MANFRELGNPKLRKVRLDMDEKQRLATLLELVERLTKEASKEKLSEAFQVMALEVAFYRSRVGSLRTDEALAMLDMTALTDEQVRWVTDALEGAAATLATIPDLNVSPELKH